MSDSDLPKVDVVYRIQNVDSRLYLERSGIPAQPSVPQMRPEDTKSKRQHWRIIRPPGSPEGEYRIVDPYNTLSPALCYNPANNANPMVVGRPANASPQHNFWNIVANAPNASEKAFYLVTIDPNGGWGVVLGNSVPSNAAPFVGLRQIAAEAPPADGSPSVQTAAVNFQWKVLEVSPAGLPDETNSKYRIRAFLGKPLQVDVAGNLNLDPTDARGEHRVWTITDKGNGKCTVYSDRARLYLTARNVSNSGGFDWQPTLRASTEPSFPEADRLWTFEKTTHLTHTIFLHRQATANGLTREFALALDGNNAILKPKKLAHNEVWLVEPIDTPMPGGGTGTGVTPGITPAFGFPPGLASNETYRFRNREWPSTTTPNFIVHNYVSWNSSGIHNYSFASSTGGTPVGIRVETKVPVGVALYTLVGNQRYYLGANGTSIVSTPLTVADNATAWTVTQISTNNGGQYTIMLEGRLLSATSTAVNLADAQSPPAAWQIWTISP